MTGQKHQVVPQIVAAVVVALLVGGTAPWWVQFIKPRPGEIGRPDKGEIHLDTGVTNSRAPTSGQPPVSNHQRAAALARTWFEVVKRGNMDSAIALSLTPFYTEHDSYDVTSLYSFLNEARGHFRNLTIDAVEPMTIGELENSTRVRMLEEWKDHIPLRIEDYFVTLFVRKEDGDTTRPIPLMIRWGGNDYKVFALPD